MQSIGGRLMSWLTPTRLTAHSTQVEQNNEPESTERHRSKSVAGFQNLQNENNDSGAYSEGRLRLSTISPIEIQSNGSNEISASSPENKTLHLDENEVIVIGSECTSPNITPVAKPWGLSRMSNSEHCKDLQMQNAVHNDNGMRCMESPVDAHVVTRQASSILQNGCSKRLSMNERQFERKHVNEGQNEFVPRNMIPLHDINTEGNYTHRQVVCESRYNPPHYAELPKSSICGGGEPQEMYLQDSYKPMGMKREFMNSHCKNGSSNPRVNFATPQMPHNDGVIQYTPNYAYEGSHRPFRKHKEPMRFNGKMDWDDYYSHFNAVAEWNGWGIHECGLQLAMSLVDDAREILSGIPVYEQNNYPILVNALKQRFAPDGKESSYSMELMNRSRKSGEDTTAYGYALMKLAKRAYPNEPLPEQALINLYINGLGDKDMKRHVYLCKPSSLDETIKIASAYEGFDEKPRIDARCEKYMKKPKMGEVNVVNASKNTQGDGLTDDLLKNFEKAMAGFTERLDRLERGRYQNSGGKPRRDKSTVECFRCKKMGHYSKECPDNPDNIRMKSENGDNQHHAGQPLN